MFGCYIERFFLRNKPAWHEIHKGIDKIENFNYLNVAFISYKLTMWDLMLVLGVATPGVNVLEKKIVLVSHRIYWWLSSRDNF